MKKKFLLVLPLITLVAGCGVKKTNIYELPKGGRDVNVADDQELLDFADLLNEAFVKSVDGLLSKVKLGVYLEHFNGEFYWGHEHHDGLSSSEYDDITDEYVRKDTSSGYTKQENVTVIADDLNLSFDINAWGIGGRIGNIKAGINSKLDGGFGYEYNYLYQKKGETTPEEQEHGTFDLNPKKAKLAAYLDQGVIYADASDSQYLDFVANIYGAIDDHANPNEFGGLVNMLTGKWEINGVIPEDVLSRPINDRISRLSTYVEAYNLGGQFCSLFNPELFPDAELGEMSDLMADLITCRIYEDNSVGVQATVTAEWFNEVMGEFICKDQYELRDNGDLSIDSRTLSDDSWLTVTILFNKDLYLSSIGVQANADYDYVDVWADPTYDGKDNGETCVTKAKYRFDASIGLTFDFNPEEVKLPNTSAYEFLDLSSLGF